MKNSQWIPILALALFACSSCGSSNKNPVPDLDEMRKNGQAEQNRGPEKPVVLPGNTVVVEKDKLVVHEQAKVDENFLVITPDSDQMIFTEGQKTAFTIHARALLPGVQAVLSAKNLPGGATLTATPTATDKEVYTLTWTAPLYTVPANASVKTLKIKLVAQASGVPTDPNNKTTTQDLVREKEISILVFKDQTAPSDLKVVDLPAEIAEGTLARFSVTVKVPGIDDKAPRKPELHVFYDRMNITAGNDYQELDGSRHIVADVSQKEAKYLGDSQWQFQLVFDTKNIPPQIPLAVSGASQPEATATHVRLSFKVFSPAGAGTPDVLKQLKIVLNKPVGAPRFDLSGLGQETLELTPGQKTRLSFFVASDAAGAQVKVDLPSLKTLPGSPTLGCVASSQKGPARQDCTLEWSVPCSATERDLTQEIRMTAVATVAGRNSEPTTQTLKIVPSKQQKPATCETPAAPPAQKQKEKKK